MKAVGGKRFCKLIEGKGRELKRINRSHYIYAKAGENARISVPVQGNEPLKLGLQRHLMKANYKSAQNKALHRTAIPLRSIAAGELDRWDAMIPCSVRDDRPLV